MSEWKSIMEEIKKAMAPQYRGGSRVAFVFYDNEIVAMRKQIQQADGTWADDMRLSYIQYLEGRYPYMDEMDHRLAFALREFSRDRGNSPYRSDAEAVLPMLIGTDRVYNPKGKLLSVIPEKPCATFFVNSDHISFSTNVDFNDLGQAFISKAYTDENDNYHVIYLDQRVREIMEMLLKMDGAPLSSAEELLDLSESLSEFIEIDVTSLKKMSAMEEVQGGGKILALIHPDGTDGHFFINLYAAPLEGGKQRFYPGAGADVYVATGAGEARMVHRNLRLETDNLNVLEGVVAGLPQAKKSLGSWELFDIESLLYLMEFIHDTPQNYGMEWPQGGEIKFRGRATKGAWDIGLTSNIRWFELDGKLTLDNVQFPLKEVIKATLNQEGDFIPVGEKEYVRISEALRKQLVALQGLCEDLAVPRYHAGRLAEVLGMGELPTVHNADYQRQLELMQEAYEMQLELPDGLNATLRDYQIEGYNWMCQLSHWGAGGCLADDMGLGKTVQTIAFLLREKEKGASLVIAPTSVVPGWENELITFAPALRPIVLNNAQNREDAVRKAGRGDVVIASYGILTNSEELLSRSEWNVIILDEAHQIKNRWTKVSRAAMNLRGKSRFILTGTPVQNSLGDLWNLFQFINPGMLGQFENFKLKYTSRDESSARVQMEMLKSATQPFILRRTKESVLDDLPKKTELDYIVTLNDEEWLYYESIRSDIEDKLSTQDPESGKMDISVFEGLTKLRLACCAPGIQHPQLGGNSSKLDALSFLLHRLIGKDTHMLIFSQFTSFLALAKPILKQMNMPFLYLDGTTPLGERAKMVKQFQHGDYPVFLISLKAGGLGLNLTVANSVILLDPWWNPSIEEQAIDRSYRIGQTQDVMVLRLIAEHTIEEKIVALQALKRNISDNVLEGTAQSGKLTYEEVMDLVKPF